MADNLNAKSPKSTEKTKITNAVNRTTSETMRLGEPEKSVNHPTSLCTTTTKERKKTPAFQITSVTVGPRISNDGGDDSADDLDESHTDDISDVIDNSRITDIENETPSYSEDTFSKEEVFFNASNASLGTAPVIPTSSQYGLAIVGPEGGPNPQNPVVTCSNNVTNSIEVSTTTVSETGNGTINIVNSVKPIESDMRDVHTHTARNERFKVVKIESTEPFKRGRWMCMDYLDHSMVQQQSQQAIIVKNEQSDAHTGSVQYVGPDSGVVLMDGLGVDHPNEHQNMPSGSEHHHQQPPMSQAVTNLSTSQNVPSGYTSSVSPGQTLQQMSMGIVHQAVPMGNEMPPHAQSMSQVPVVGMIQQQQTTMGQSLPPQQMQTLLQGYQQSGYYPSTQHLASQASSMPVQNQPLATSIAQPISMQGSMTMTAPQQHIMTQPQYQTQPPPQQQYQQAPQHLQQPQLSQPSPGMQTVPPTVQMTQPIQVSQPLPTQPIQVQVSQSIQPQPIQVQVSQPMQVHTQPVQVSQSMQVPSQPVPVQSSQSMQIPTQIHMQGQSQPIQVPHHMQAQSQPVQMSQQMQGVQVAQMSQQMQGQSQPMQVPQMQPQSQPIQVSQPMQSQPQQMQGPTQSMQSQSQPIQGQSQPLNPQSQQIQAQQMQAQSLQQQMQVQSQPVQVPQQIHAQSQPVQMPQMQAQSQPVVQQVQSQSQPVQVTQMQNQSQSVPHVQHVQQVQVSQMQGQSQPIQVPQMQAQPQSVQVQHQMQTQSQPLQVTTQMQSQSQPVQMPPQMQQHSQPVAVSQHMTVQPLPVSQPMTSQPMSVPIQQVPQQPMQQLHVVGVPQSMVTPTSMSGMPTTPLPSGYVNAPSAVAGSVVEMAIHPEPVQEPPTGIQQDKAVAGDMVQSGPAGDDNPGPAANEEPESASGTSAVAIDNKIEQAMDLVKSHLMFAVREEVEVLKERIAELMERINQLELENTILKAHASQETLAQLGSNKGSVVASAAQQPASTQQQQQQQQQQQTPGQGPPVSQAQSGSAGPAALANSGPAPNMV